MTITKPPCPTCTTNTKVRILGGGSYPKYRYVCDTCDLSWQETPQHRKSIDFVNDDDVVVNKGKQTKRSTSYICGICKKPKKNHKCIPSDDRWDLNETAELLVSNNFKTASKALSSDKGTDSTLDIPFPILDGSI